MMIRPTYNCTITFTIALWDVSSTDTQALTDHARIYPLNVYHWLCTTRILLPCSLSVDMLSICCSYFWGWYQSTMYLVILGVKGLALHCIAPLKILHKLQHVHVKMYFHYFFMKLYPTVKVLVQVHPATVWQHSVTISQLYYCIVTLSHGLLMETTSDCFNSHYIQAFSPSCLKTF